MRMAIDEHHQHKDVYQHSLTVLRQAIELEDDGARPGAAVGGAAARHRQAGHPQARSRRRSELSPPRGGRRQDDPQADAGAEVLQADDRRRVAAGVPAPAVPRLRRRQVDRLGGAPLRHRRGPAAAAGCTSWCAPTAPPATSAARPGCRPTTTTSRPASPSWPRRRTWQRVRPDLDGNEIMQLLGIPAGPAGRGGVAVSQGAAAGPRAADPRRGRRRVAVVVERRGSQ